MEIKKLVSDYIKLKRQKEKIDEEMKKLKNQIEEKTDKDCEVELEDRIVNIKYVERKRKDIDKKKLETKYPDVYKEVIKETISKYIDIREKVKK